MSGDSRLILPRRAVLTGGAAVVLGAAAPAPDFSALEHRLAGGRLGVFATNGAATLAHRADERFPMASTFKALLAACVLARVDAGQERLDRMISYGPADLVAHAPVTGAHVKDGRLSIETLCKAIVEVSDNPGANLLLKAIGGPPALTAWLRGIGDPTTRLDRYELELNEALPGDPRDTTTPRAMAETWGRLFDGKVLSQASRRRLEGWLIDASTGLQRLRKDTPAGWRVGDKTGNGASGSSNDVAVFWPPKGRRIYVAAYMTGTSVSMDVRNQVHAEIGRIVPRKAELMADTGVSGRLGAAPTPKEMWGWVARGEVGLALGIVGVVVLLILPVPAFLLDVLLALSITSAVLILMTALLIKKPLEFTAFPTVLLVTTLYRLGLNIASTRLILGHGHEGAHGAGAVIETFGRMMMGGNFVIGVIVFAILVLVNFVVITKGSGRIAEVSARFTLDAMPGKQMAIDADLSAGLIDQDQAKTRRKELEQESTFFGAMDGASKFVRGDAIAGLIIVAINVIGGILIGVLQHKIPLGQAASTYTIMTIGDGLVSQIPALIISIAAGLLVSKAGVEGSADKALVTQLAMNPISLGMVAASAGMIAFIPGMPIIPFALVSMGAGALAWRRSQKAAEPPPVEIVADLPADEEEPIAQTLAIDEIKIELGYGLLGLINDLEGRRLTDQIKALRKTLAADFGFVMPSVRILDNMRLPSQGYAIRIKEMEAGAGEVRLGQLMAMDPRGGQVELPGEHVKEPAFGLPATWIDDGLREEASFRGYTIVDPATVLTTHLTEILKENMPDLLSYAEVQKLLADLPQHQKKLVEDLVPSVVTTTTIQRVLQALLRERVSIRDLGAILEGIGEAAPHTASITLLVEQVRARLGRQLCYAYRSDDGALPIITLSGEWENAFAEALVGGGEEKQLALAPSRLQDFIRGVRESFERAALSGESPVLLTSPAVRPYVRSIIERFRGQTPVMSQNEIHPRARLRTVGSI